MKLPPVAYWTAKSAMILMLAFCIRFAMEYYKANNLFWASMAATTSIILTSAYIDFNIKFRSGK